MTYHRRALGIAVVVLVAGLTLTSGIAAAQTGRVHVAPLKGTVQNLGASSFQLKTSAGTSTVAFTSSTRVTKIVTGSVGDLTAGARVSVRFVTGSTTTVKSVQIQPALTRKASDGTNPPHSGAKKTWTKTTGSASTGARPTSTSTHSGASGRIVSFKGNTLTMSERHGTTAIYTLAGGAAITKVTASTVTALANGQTVTVAARSGSAVFISILAA